MQVLHDIDRSNNGTSHMKLQFDAFFSGYEAYTFPFPVKLVEDIPKLSKLSRATVLGPRSCSPLVSQASGSALVSRASGTSVYFCLGMATCC